MPPPNGIGGLNRPLMLNPPTLHPMVLEPQLGPLLPPEPEPQSPEQLNGPSGPGMGHDPVVQELVENGSNGPNFEPGAGQVRQLAQGHDLAGGRDWDIASAKGSAELAAQAAKRVREMVSGSADFRQSETNVATMVASLPLRRRKSRS